MSDYDLEDTIFLPFTTRQFSDGVPTVLAGTPAIDIYEDATAAPIVTGETLAVSLNGLVGFNMITVTATAAQGFNAGGFYTAVIQAGTVDGVNVFGEVVATFSIRASAAAVDLANGTDGLTALKTGIDDIPTVSEFNARTIVSASYFDPAADAVANVTLVATTTTNTDMRGTDSAALASVATEARLSELDDASGKMVNQVDIIQIDTTTDIPAQITALNNVSIADILASQLTESYAADGVAPTLSQAIFLIQQMLGDFSIAGTTLTVRKIDGAATAATFTLDSATVPTDLTRTT